MKDNDMLSHPILSHHPTGLCVLFSSTLEPSSVFITAPNHSYGSIAVYLFTCAIQRYHLSKRNNNLLINFIARGTRFCFSLYVIKHSEF